MLNELVENAVKFSAGGTVVIDAGVERASSWSSSATRSAATRSTACVSSSPSLLDGDPAELPSMQRVEENAANPELTTSGLGFLTMLSDYKARLSWRFDPAPGN